MKKLKIKKINLRKLKSGLKDKPIVFSAIIVVLFSVGIIFGGTTLLSKLLSYGDMLNTGYTEVIESISFQSDGWDSSDPGSVKVTKSASWTDKHEATIDIIFDSKDIAYEDKDRNIILVLDTSISMTEERVKSVNESIIGLLDVMFDNTNNKLALISFDSEAILQTGFTNDRTLIEEKLSSLVSSGATNYYLALKEVEELMDNSNVDDADTHLIFITDGVPTEGKTMHAKQAQIIKNKYPEMFITAIQFEMSDEIANPIIEISDYQYYSFGDTIDDVLLDAYKTSSYFESIVLTDYIHDEYFHVESVDDIDVTHGSVKLEDEGTKQKVTWSINKGKVKSGTVIDVKMSIKAKIQEEYWDDYGYLPTNRSTSVVAKADGISDVNASTTETPVLKSWVDVVYDSNVPTGCSTTYSKTSRFFPFSNATIDGDSLTCAGYLFKGWQVVDADARLLGDELFELPGHDVTVGAEWTKLDVAKSMEGSVYEEPTLYNFLKSESVLSTTASINYTNGTNYDEVSGLFMYDGNKNSTYPTLFYRGQVANNNVVFANKCWKIIMTTQTGGIKIAYNGTATNNKCTSTGSSLIGTDNFNYIDEYDYSLTDGGYMTSSTRYKNNWVKLGEDNVFGALGFTTYEDTTHYSGSYYYASSISSYTSGGTQYVKLVGLSKMSGSSSLIGKYTAFYSTSSANWSFVHYIVDVDTATGTIYYVNIYPEHYNSYGSNAGATLKTKAENVTWYYANDVTYANGVYTLVNPQAYKPINFGTDNTTISDNYLHYVCMEDGAKSCSTVSYIFNVPEHQEITPYWIELTGGKKIENAVDDMLNVVPTKNSTVKDIVDNWYVNNIQAYSSLLEVGEYTTCNNREAAYIGGWNPDEKFLGNEYFFDYNFTDATFGYGAPSDRDKMYYCRDVDTLSVANGRLKYPISLLTLREVTVAGNADTYSSHDTYLTNGEAFWLMDPRYHHNIWNEMNFVNANGGIDYVGVKEETRGIRPVVALDNSVMATGTGTAADPYVIKAG